MTSPVMIRSRVSFATGWMSDGRGPAPAMEGRDHTPRRRGERQRLRAACLGADYKCRDALRHVPSRCAARSRRGSRSARSQSSSGTGPAAGQRRRRPDLLRPLAARRRARAARARPARARPRLRQRRYRGRRHGRRDRAARHAGSRRPLDRGDISPPAARRRARRRHPAAAEAARCRARAQRPPPQQGARREGGPPPLRRLQRVLRPLPRRLDDLQLRLLRPRAPRRWSRRRKRSSTRSPASWR